MFEKLEITRMAQAMAAHAGTRMGVIAQNVAHADNPGYKARDLPDFAKTYADETGQGLRVTRAGHLGAGGALPLEAVVMRASDAPNGNSVSLEREMVKAAEVRQQHDMALSIYRATSDIMKLALGRGR
ncbi:FlgB family protein [Pseudorhodobacter ferrugineus]|uniref:FlgB family protein n=1 Tax=Pseudorhodobacter ferrugineus TaxID=77008 RepID=UPI0003B32D2D|nr:FlgB family protein [Pseudorhodobacter ferrugineus]